MSEHRDLAKLALGRLTWDAIPLHDPILLATFIVVAVGGVATVVALTYFRAWGTLWRDWITSIDHKKIGVMYVILGLVMLLRGFADAVMMRLQQAIAFGDAMGYLLPHHYDQIFSAHGVIMIFFVAMPLVTGIMNFVVPLQIGARDVAFPFLNNFSFWMTACGAVLVMMSLFVGEFARTGWLAYPPLSGLIASPDVGVDYYIWSLQVAGVGTMLSGVNLIATIVKMRAPGMGVMKMPVFTWTALCTNILIVAAFPGLTAVLALLSLDRYVVTNFFTNDLGGNPMMYVNLIWIWGHPEVYILVLPAFGIFSEVVSTFCGKRLFGYASMVYATLVITILSYLVWLHHFFTMGSGASVNAFFGITTMIISIPTGAKIFNWLFTMYRGRIRFEAPLYVLGLMGVTRRLSHFDDTSLQIWFEIAAFGALLILLGILSFIIQLVVSFLRRASLTDTTGDPWNGRTLEWSTSSPPPVYNFAFTPIVYQSDAWYDMKKRGHVRPVTGFVPIHMPKNTGAGFVLAVLSTICAFGMIWHMWPVAAAGFVSLIVAAIVHTFNYDREFYIPAEAVLRAEDARTRLLASHV